jgi:hypothetical protein
MAAFDVSVPRVLVAIALVGSIGCQLKRPDTLPSRMIEPQMEAPAKPAVAGLNVMFVRLLDTQARAHIGRRLLRQEADGELVEDSVWRWSSAPDRYLDTALRLELTSRPDAHHDARRRRPQRAGQKSAAHQVSAGADADRKVDHLGGEDKRAHHAQQGNFGIVKPALRHADDVGDGGRRSGIERGPYGSR